MPDCANRLQTGRLGPTASNTTKRGSTRATTNPRWTKMRVLRQIPGAFSKTAFSHLGFSRKCILTSPQKSGNMPQNSHFCPEAQSEPPQRAQSKPAAIATTTTNAALGGSISEATLNARDTRPSNDPAANRPATTARKQCGPPVFQRAAFRSFASSEIGANLHPVFGTATPNAA